MIIGLSGGNIYYPSPLSLVYNRWCMNFKIVPFEEKWLEEMTELFSSSYQDPGYEWDVPTSRKYLQNSYCPEFAKFCFAAVNDKGECLGAIFCNIDAYETGNFLYISQIQVKPEFRRLGIARSLMKKAMRAGKESGCKGTHLLTDSRKFTTKFYESLGYDPSGWIEMEMHWR